MKIKMFQLTKVHRHKLVLLAELFQHLSVDFFDFSRDLKHLLRRQPAQDPLLVGHVALEHNRQLLAEIDLPKSINLNNKL